MKILVHHRASDGTYGSSLITVVLLAEGERVSKNAIAVIMADLGTEGIVRSPTAWAIATTLSSPPSLRAVLSA
ncbi:hypothetical protein ACFXPS_17890 [Nocardia sp. NPDC059091]|uniref:hypothetical protein n=1 Tax=Nocardia sp. NPDC059091 TaxID=3346724 RepID=UPI0036BFCB1B